MTHKVLKISLLFFVLFSSIEAYPQIGKGGTKSIFSGGIGARALSLGNAYVALASDPSAVYWNPAGLDFIEKKSVSFFYSSLILQANYNFVGFVIPTTSIGSIGIGWIRLDAGEFEPRDDRGLPELNQGSSQNQFLFSYAKQIRSTLSIGFTAKLERSSIGQNASDTGVGADFGILYQPAFDNPALRDISFGINFQNVLAPRTRLVDTDESTPRNFKVGIAKLFLLGEERNSFRLLFDFNKSENATSSMHFGSEFSFNNQANVRIGFNDGQIAFGAGAKYNNFHLDYNFGKLFDSEGFSGNHRFSVTVEFGKGKTEVIRIAQEQRERDFRIRADNELWFNEEADFNNQMEEGRIKYYDKDYLGALVDFTNAADAASSLVDISMRYRTQNFDDPDANMRVDTANSSLQEAQTMLELANTKNDSARKQERDQIILEARQSVMERELQDFILEHKEKGIAFFKVGLYTKAIDELRLALDRINRGNGQDLPDWVVEVRDQLQSQIRTAENQLQGNVQQTIKRAAALARRGRYVEAMTELQNARGSGLSASERKTVARKIRSYQNQLKFSQNYNEGVRLYANKDWRNAMKAFDRALKIKSNHRKARKYFEDAKARALATRQPIPAELRAKYREAITLYRAGRFSEALPIFDEIRKEQPYNKDVLTFIDNILEKLK